MFGIIVIILQLGGNDEMLWKGHHLMTYDLMRRRREWWVSKKSKVSVWSLTWNSSRSTGNDKTWIGIIKVFNKNCCCYTDRNKDRIELEEKSTELKYLWIHRDVFLSMSFSDVLLYVYDGPLVSHWLLSLSLKYCLDWIEFYFELNELESERDWL